MTTGSTAIDEYRRLIKAREAIDAAIEACVQKAIDVSDATEQPVRSLPTRGSYTIRFGTADADRVTDLYRNANSIIARHEASRLDVVA